MLILLLLTLLTPIFTLIPRHPLNTICKKKLNTVKYATSFENARLGNRVDQPPQKKEENPASDFNYLRKLQERCTVLSRSETEMMLSFWNKQLNCFQIFPNMNSSRVSVITTCMSLNVITANPSAWCRDVQWSDKGVGGAVSIESVVNSLHKASWSMDPFQTPVLLSTLCALKAVDTNSTKYCDAVEAIIEQRSRLSLHRDQPYSTYLRFQNIKALLAIVDNRMIPDSKESISERIGYALERASMVSFDELCRQLAFYNSGDSASFDVIILAYTLLSYWESSQSLFLSSFARGVVPPTNIKLVKEALKIIFSVQAMDGTWRKGEPIFNNGENNGNRDIGNSYVFFFDMIADMLTTIGQKKPEFFEPYLHNLERCLAWAEANILQEMLPDVCDESTGRCIGAIVKGWRSNHLGPGGAVGWCTAQVFSGVSSMRKLLKTLINDNILKEFKGKRVSSFDVMGNSREWNELMDADLELAGARSTLKIELFNRLLVPQQQKEFLSTSMIQPPVSSDSLSFSKSPPLYSAILFGPPGTAKTTICTSIASFLGWNFVSIDTAQFLSDGLMNVASRMTYIFERLKSLERTIILLDEIEEFCLDRENPNLAMESRLLTTAMLTQLNELRRQQTCIFIVATNRLRSFDAAVTRPGRFDLLLFVGTPNLEARVRRLSNKLKGTVASIDDIKESVAIFENFLIDNWDTARFMTFAENDALQNFVIDMSNRKNLTSRSIREKYVSIIRTATIQGQVKEEYIASESMSRT